MKKLIYLSLAFILLVLFSCNKNDVASSNFSEALLVGDWKIEAFSVSNSNQDHLYNDFSNANFSTVHSPILLSFDDQKTYNKNYVNGFWKLDQNTLQLLPKEDRSITRQNYELIELSEETMSLKVVLNKNQYLYAQYFTNFDDNDLLTIIEHYTRQ